MVATARTDAAGIPGSSGGGCVRPARPAGELALTGLQLLLVALRALSVRSRRSA